MKIIPLTAEMHAVPYTTLFVTGLYSGRIKPASGTWGTFAVLPFAYAISYFTGMYGLIAAAVITAIGGTMLINRYLASVRGDEDPSEIVIDEWAGMLIALIPAGLSPVYWILAFGMFRLFDAVKMGPVGWCDRNIHGGKGVMLDDIVAGILAAACLYGVIYLV